MKVLEVYHIKGRGCVAIVKLDDQKLIVGTILRRKSDQLEVKVSGVEWFAILRRPHEGDTVGLRVSPDVSVGDELERIT